MKDKKYAGIIALGFIAAITAFTIWGTGLLSGMGKATEVAMDVANAKGVKEAFKLEDKDGNTVGFKVVASQEGYKGPVDVTVTFDADGTTITAYEVGENSETPALGGKVAEAPFKDQFNDAKAPVKLKGASGEGTEVEAVSGATITSKAVVEAVNGAYEFVQNNK